MAKNSREHFEMKPGMAAAVNASAAVADFLRGVNYHALNEAAAAFQQRPRGGGDVRRGGDATARDDKDGGAAGASSIFIQDGELMNVFKEYEGLASKLKELNKKTSSPSLGCNTCALVCSRGKECTEFVSLSDLKKLHAMGFVAVLSAIESCTSRLTSPARGQSSERMTRPAPRFVKSRTSLGQFSRMCFSKPKRNALLS